MPKPPLSASLKARRRTALRWLYGFLHGERRRILLLAGLSLLTSSLVLIQPYFTKLIIDDGLLAGDFDQLLTFSLLLLGIGFVTTVFAGVNRIQHTRLSGTVLFALREDVYHHLQTLSPRYFARQRTGDLISRLDRDVAEVQRFAVDTLFSVLSAVLGLLGTVGMMLMLSWQLSLALVIILPVQWLFLGWIRPQVHQQNRRLRERSSDLSSFLTETIPAMKFIQNCAAEGREQLRLQALNRHFLADLISLQKTEFIAGAVPSLLVSSTRALVFLIGGYWVIQGTLPLGSLIAFTAYLGMAFGPVQSLLGLVLNWERMLVSLDRVLQLREQTPEQFHVERKPLPERLTGHLQLRDISFAYSDSHAATPSPNQNTSPKDSTAETPAPSSNSHPIFNTASVTIEAGQKVGLYGASGIGKSTLVDLLLRHYPLLDGQILLDGHDIAQFESQQLRQKIALVSQDCVIFNDSIANNIRYCQADASDQQIEQVAQQVGLQCLLERLPKGINSVVSERGSTLSGGEKQRIALARALLQQPILVILDEPTSAVDPALEKQMIAAVDRLFAHTTRLIISHREAPLADTDQLLTIDSGQLIATTPNLKIASNE
jgi:ATP-binding cassette subfamily B protein